MELQGVWEASIYMDLQARRKASLWAAWNVSVSPVLKAHQETFMLPVLQAYMVASVTYIQGSL